MNTPLQQAAQAVIDRWDSPLWKDQPHTGVYIAELRKALADEQAQATRTALEQYDLDQSADYQKGWNDGRIKGYEVGHRYATEAKQAQAVEFVAWLVLDEDRVPIMCAPAKQMCNDHINDAINDFDITEASKWAVREAFTHPAPPATGERADLIADLRLNHEYCPKEVILFAADMLEADAQEIAATERQVEADVSLINEGNKAQQVAVPARGPLSDSEINAIWSEPLDRSKLSPFGMSRIRAILAAANDIGDKS